MRFNTAISQLMIFVNALQKEPVLPRAVLRDLLSLLAPLAPHLAEELWARVGFEGTAAAANWPAYDPAKLVANTITIVIQVNGKHRGEVEAPTSVTDDELKELALQNAKVVPYVTGKEIKRVIYVKGRLINLLV
jgi:leucyl-tRNA synthetase